MKYLKLRNIRVHNNIKTKKQYSKKQYSKKQYSKKQYSKKQYSNKTIKTTSRSDNNLNLKYHTKLKYNSFITEIGKCKVYFKTYNTNKLNNSNPYKIISVSYFILPDYGPITKDNKYLKGLNNLVKNANKYLSDYKVRIYCDEHGFKLLDNLLYNPRVEIFIYTIPQFLETNKSDNKKYHKGYIGTMMRFLPFFNYKNHNVDIVINLDIDNNLTLYNAKMINKEVYKHSFFYKWRACYNANHRLINLGYIKYPVIASFISMNKSKLSLPNSLLNNFFDTHLLKDDDRYMSYLRTINLDILFRKGDHKEHNKEINKFMYGVDEYFLNYNVLKWFKSNNILITAFDLFYSLKLVLNELLDICKKIININDNNINNDNINNDNINNDNILIQLFIYIQSLMYILEFKYEDKLTKDNYKNKISEFKSYLETLNFELYYHKKIKTNKKRNFNYIKTVNNILKFIKDNKKILEYKLQNYECIKYNLEIYKVNMKQYHIQRIKLNDNNCIFYTTKQLETHTNYTLL